MPLVIAVVGIMGTYLVTNEQREAAKIRADADRQVKILDIFANKLMSHEEEEKFLAASMTMAMDRDLATKMMAAFDMIALAPKDEKSERFRLFEKSLISHAIISKLAEGKTGIAYQKAILEGHWLLFRQPDYRAINWLEFRAGEIGITVHGDAWDGEVIFDGKRGYYLWEFKKGHLKGWTGRTDFLLDRAGILFGAVKGDKEKGNTKEAGLEWIYWGIRGEKP